MSVGYFLKGDRGLSNLLLDIVTLIFKNISAALFEERYVAFPLLFSDIECGMTE